MDHQKNKESFLHLGDDHIVIETCVKAFAQDLALAKNIFSFYL